MIGKLRGKIDLVQEEKCILDVNGVGYLVNISTKTAQNLKNLAPFSEVILFIETVVKEDAIDLYGFTQEIEKIWFLELTKVQGVGSKMGQKILSSLNVEELAKALSVADIKTFQNISGIGPKLAQRICVELKNSPKKLGIATEFLSNFDDNDKLNFNNNITLDALSALENLGYKKHDCQKFINHIFASDPEITLENLITQSLRELSKKK